MDRAACRYLIHQPCMLSPNNNINKKAPTTAPRMSLGKSRIGKIVTFLKEKIQAVVLPLTIASGVGATTYLSMHPEFFPKDEQQITQLVAEGLEVQMATILQAEKVRLLEFYSDPSEKRMASEVCDAFIDAQDQESQRKSLLLEAAERYVRMNRNRNAEFELQNSLLVARHDLRSLIFEKMMAKAAEKIGHFPRSPFVSDPDHQ